MTQDTEAGDVDRLLATLSAGDVQSRRAAARGLAAVDVRGREQALLDAMDAATDDVVKLWVAVALARAGQEVGLEELFGRWREDLNRPLSGAYPDLHTLAGELAPVLPLHPAATQLLESYARIENTWIGELARILLGRWSPPEQGAVTGEHPRPARRKSRPQWGSGPGSHAENGGTDALEDEFYSDVFAESPFDGGLDGGFDGPFEAAAPPPPPPAPPPPPPPPAAPAAAPPTYAPPPPPPAPPPPSSAPAAGGAAPVSAEPVLLGGSAPRRVQPGDFFIAQLAAYIAAFEPEAERELKREARSDDIRLGQETDCRWPAGTRVSVRCQARGGLVAPAEVQSFVWDGQCRTVSFEMEVPADARPRDAVITMEVFVHDRDDAPDAVQVAKLRMGVEITAEAPAAPEPPRTVRAAAARTAFASYASQDRGDVLERVSSIERSAGLEVFVDVVDLRMGEEWNPALEQHILSSDRFLLFWSEHAAASKWVTWEREHAVKAHGEDVLELHLLRYTPIDQVPQELRKYHFNDVYLMARDAELYRREQAAKASGG